MRTYTLELLASARDRLILAGESIEEATIDPQVGGSGRIGYLIDAIEEATSEAEILLSLSAY